LQSGATQAAWYIGIMARLILLTHRYLGIAVGALMVMWCLSGVVMMYVSYPALGESVRLEHLQPLAWHDCCKIADALRADFSFKRIGIEMLGGRPVLFSGEESRPVDLSTGSWLEGISADQAAEVAQSYAASDSPAAPHLLGLIDRDQWTVSGEFNSARPLYHFRLADEARTELYVSSRSGRAVQMTTARERFWNWLGAVPHWLYFTELRHQPKIWSQVVIYTSLLGCFLAGVGLYLGIRQFAARPAGRWSPYVGFNLWHHIAGLAFGVFALSWVLSGLLSMNPWGWLQGAGAQAESAAIEGAPRSSADLAAVLQNLANAHPAAVSLQAAPLNDQLYFIASAAGGERRRLNERGEPARLSGAELKFLSNALGGAGPPSAPQLLTQEDSYYFSHHREPAALPVYRLVLASGSRYYLDSVSGMLLAKLDAGSRAYRWLHEGLHRLDFAAWMRTRPLWDLLMLLLMSGVTVLCVTGAYLGYRRLTGFGLKS
jgi:PepSY-associated TM region